MKPSREKFFPSTLPGRPRTGSLSMAGRRGQTVIFQISSLDIDNAVIPGSYDYVIIGANPNTPSRLELIVDPALGSSRPARNLLLSGKLTTVNFVYDNSDFALTRRVDYTILVTDVGRSPGQEQISGSVTLRNK